MRADMRECTTAAVYQPLTIVYAEFDEFVATWRCEDMWHRVDDLMYNRPSLHCAGLQAKAR